LSFYYHYKPVIC